MVVSMLLLPSIEYLHRSFYLNMCSLFFGLLYPTAKSIEAVESVDSSQDDAQVIDDPARLGLLLGTIKSPGSASSLWCIVAHVLDYLHSPPDFGDNPVASPPMVSRSHILNALWMPIWGDTFTLDESCLGGTGLCLAVG